MWSKSVEVLNPYEAVLESKKDEEIAEKKEDEKDEKVEKKSLRDKIVDVLKKIEVKWVVK